MAPHPTERPECVALVPCHGIIREAGYFITVDRAFIGLRSVEAKYLMEQVAVYVCVTNVYETDTFTFAILKASATTLEETLLFRSPELQCNTKGPLEHTQFGVTIAKPEFEVPGEYLFRLEWKGETLAQRRVHVRTMENM